ncbi:hypothetical protein BDQ94DRAFT_136339 [Aspergillus welwitschiae]|uniref:Uncharacterized protein n=1 Tax=Aspergillus welwitschiae TaxID=1341132 RepID=A0A3F3QE28_9EURO|nr:hypothetical protein BDQ94DRAFT_136339 [Aspergillus welwitschiae]RDH37387.1 hypothetical protein BDQ94DRAFT_136339 [Aspergillus welwitschiae]
MSSFHRLLAAVPIVSNPLLRSVSLRSLIAWLIPSARRRRHGYGPWSVSGPFAVDTSRLYCRCSFAILTNPPPSCLVFLQFPHEFFFRWSRGVSV